MIRTSLTDLVRAFRVFRTRPSLALLVGGAYALGIGVVTAVFSLVDDAVLDPLPWPAAREVVGVWERRPDLGPGRLPAAPAKITAWREQTDVFSAVSAWRLEELDLTGLGEPERLPVGRVEPGLMELLGVEPELGRGFGAEEAAPGGADVALLSHGFWIERFGGDPGVLGRTLTLEGASYQVLGVLPRGQHFPPEAEVVVPLRIEFPTSRASHAFRVLARLSPGVDVERARRRLDALAIRLQTEFAETDKGWEVTVLSLRDQLLGDLGPLLLMLLAAGGLVFLVACANGAGLLLVRAAARRREVGVRYSLGASRGRLIWHLATESLALSLAGGLAGLVVAHGLGTALRVAAPLDLPAPRGAGFDPTVYAFALAATAVAGLAFGLLPALRGTEGGPMHVLREGQATGGPGRSHLRSAVVSAEVALAALLLVGSGLFLRSARKLLHVDPGFDTSNLLVADVRPATSRYSGGDARRALYRELLDAAGALPSVRSAALVNYVPLGGRSDMFRFQIEGRPPPTFADLEVAGMRSVSAGYFETMTMEIRAGRPFTSLDREDAERVAIVSDAMARAFWPTGDAVGGRISFESADGPWVTVVGIVQDVHHAGLAEPAAPEVYVPMPQETWPAASLVLRTDGDPLRAADALRRAVTRVDPLLPVSSVQSGRALIDRATAPWRFQAALVSAFAIAAVLVALTGVYGLLAYVVQERTAEMAIRRALGARSGDIGRIVGREALALASTGAVLGLATAAALSTTVRGLLFGVSPLDPWSYLAAGALLVGVGAAAAWAPARRAARVAPAGVLRAS